MNVMKRIFGAIGICAGRVTLRRLQGHMLALTCLLAAVGHASTNALPPRADFGDAQVAAIQARYASTPDDCGGTTIAAVVCSGVLIRITGNGVGYHVWNPSSGSVTRGGVSFSYLRSDTRFGGLVWNDLDGLIFSSARDTDGATLHPVTMCAFPLDAATALRPDRGCGRNGTIAASAPCQEQGIFTASQWFNHFTTAAAGRADRQCGFTVDGAPDAAPTFLASLEARALLPTSRFQTHNELMLATWPQNIGASLPIQAFFYLVENGASGVAGAQRNQRDLLQTDGVAVPVIRVTLPADPTEQASFAFDPADQVIEAPALPGAFALTPSVPLAPLGALRLQDVLDNPRIDVLLPPEPGIRTGDTARVRWMGDHSLHETPAQVLTAGSIATFHVPRGSVLATLGQRVAVSFVVTSGSPSALERVSPVRTIAVQDRALSLPPPIVGPDRRYVTIDYPSMATGDHVIVTYEGADLHDVPHRVAAPGAFNVGLVPSWLEGPPGRVRYAVQAGGQGAWHLSADALVGQRIGPLVHDAANGWLDFAALAADPTVEVPPWEGISEGQSVWLDALAYAPDGTELRAMLLDGVNVGPEMVRDGVHATLPRAWLERLPDGSAVFLRMRSGTSFDLAAAFPVTRITLRNAPGPMVSKTLPRLVDHRADGSVVPFEGVFSRSALQGNPQVRVPPWPGMKVGQRVSLHLRGRATDGGPTDIPVADAAVTAADLTDGLVAAVPRQDLDALAEDAPLRIELDVTFETTADGPHTLRFPVNQMAVGK